MIVEALLANIAILLGLALVLWVIGQPRIIHPNDGIVALQKLGQLLRVVVLLPHPQRQRLESPV